MLYHIDNTPEMPSDRFGTGWYDKRYEQSWTVSNEMPADPVDTTDRAYINYWIKIWIDLCYGKWREMYWIQDNYYAWTKERIMRDYLDDLYTRARTNGITGELIEDNKLLKKHKVFEYIDSTERLIIALCSFIVFLVWTLLFVLI